MKTFALAMVLFAATASIGGWVSTFEPVIHPVVKTESRQVNEEQAGASLLGQFRTSFTSWLWLRTDLYLHNGVEMRKLTDAEMRTGEEAAHNADHDDDGLCIDGTTATVIPSAERDFRGVFGDIERATTAFEDMSSHHHNDPKTTLPLFRLLTLIDPQFTPAWVVGGSIMARDRSAHALREAEAFLRRGLYENPKALTIRVQLGELQIVKKHDLEAGAATMKEAVRIGTLNPKRLDEEDELALDDAFRWLALCQRDLGDLDGMEATARFGLTLFPKDKALERLLKDSVPMVPTILRDSASN
ncbi:MAG: hypothetical protein HZC36_13085 [Armatimonadetes bacterium]|nr:hypothetical protein [Armatimonadota bacterium]